MGPSDSAERSGATTTQSKLSRSPPPIETWSQGFVPGWEPMRRAGYALRSFATDS
jgi:hypothetical protein